MALRAVPDHPKFAELKARLGRPKCVTLGCLETVWHFTARYTPAGNIGKYSDQAIEMWAEWDGKPGDLIASLTESHWIDADPTHRLVVHDWPQHADGIVHTTLARDLQLFADGRVPECGRLNQRERERFHQWIKDRGLPSRPRGGQPKDGEAAAKQPQSGHEAATNPKPSLAKPKPSLAKPKPSLAKPKAKAPAKAKPLPDSRAGEFKTSFQDAFQVANSVPAPWDAKEATNLARFLKANPTITVEQWRRILYHRSISPLNQKASLSTWVAKCLAWLDGPADEWGKPLKTTPANVLPFQPVATAREMSDEEAYRVWEGMSAGYKQQNPWTGPIPATAKKEAK